MDVLYMFISWEIPFKMDDDWGVFLFQENLQMMELTDGPDGSVGDLWFFAIFIDFVVDVG